MKITDEMVKAGAVALKDADRTHDAAKFPHGALGHYVPWAEHAARQCITAALEAAVADAPEAEAAPKCPNCGVPVTYEPACGFIATCGQRVLTPRAGGCQTEPTKDDESLWRDKAQEQAKTIDVLYNALRKILFARPLGPLPNTKLGKLVEEIEVIARDAVDRHEHRRAALNAEGK